MPGGRGRSRERTPVWESTKNLVEVGGRKTTKRNKSRSLSRDVVVVTTQQSPSKLPGRKVKSKALKIKPDEGRKVRNVNVQENNNAQIAIKGHDEKDKNMVGIKHETGTVPVRKSCRNIDRLNDKRMNDGIVLSVDQDEELDYEDDVEQ